MLQCLGYDDIFNKYSNDGSMDESSLGKAVSALLYFAQEPSCIELPAKYHSFHKKPTTVQGIVYIMIAKQCIMDFKKISS